METKYFGALEAGGTKIICGIVDSSGKIIDQSTFPTKSPEETIPVLLNYFKKYQMAALGIGTFGPVDVREGSPTYGSILSTPKPGWKDFSYIQNFKELGVPIGIDTDVNASCIGEMTFGSAKGLKNVIYITIGTGIGVGICAEGKMIHGILHPEAGHVLLSKRSDDKGESSCPFHQNCLEGLASGPSLQKRYGKPANELRDNKEVWDLEADYIAQAIVGYIFTVCPQRIILGGGVMHQEHLFELIRKKVIEKINGYVVTKELEKIDEYIIPASLNDDQGLLGSAKIGMDAYSKLDKK